MSLIQIIPPEDASGYLKEVYKQLIKDRGKIANVHMLHSLHPQSLVDHMQLYQTLLFGKSPLKRWQREMLAVVVSSSNQCLYCIRHHSEALLHFWKDKKRVNQLKKDFAKTNLAEVDHLLCQMGQIMTLQPKSVEIKKIVVKIQSLGHSDRLILDAQMIISYFNFVNRLVLGLDINTEPDPGGYVYD